MRIGTHAIVDGVEYRAGFGPQSTNIGLFVPGDQPQPEGFDWSSDMGGGGRWVKLVPRSTAQRLFSVATWALYKDKYPVNLDSVEPGGKAIVFYDEIFCGPFPSLPLHTEPPPGFNMMANREGWSARIDIADLSDIRERVTEHPLEPQPRLQHW